MRHRVLSAKNREKTRVLVFDEGAELMAELLDFVRERGIVAASFSGIGAFSRVELRYFDWETKQYEPIRVTEQVELLSLTGNVALHRGEPRLHAHVVLGRRDGSTCGGHLASARVRPTAELVLVESPVELRRTIDETTGLPLISFDEE